MSTLQEKGDVLHESEKLNQQLKADLLLADRDVTAKKNEIVLGQKEKRLLAEDIDVLKMQLAKAAVDKRAVQVCVCVYCVYLCIHECIYVHMCVCICTYLHLCIFIRVYIHVYICIYVYIYICVRSKMLTRSKCNWSRLRVISALCRCVCVCVCVCICVFVYILTCIYLHVCVCACVCIYTRVHIYMHVCKCRDRAALKMQLVKAAMCVYLCMYIYMCIYICTYMCVHTYRYIYMYVLNIHVHI